MNYKQQAHFLNDVSTWRAHIPALITMDIIKSPFLHQCRLHLNVYGFKIVQKSFIQSSSNLQDANHLGFSCQQRAAAKRRVGCFVHEKRFSYFLRNKNPRVLILSCQAPPSSLLGARRHHFSGLRSFRKTAFTNLLTVLFRWNFDRWSIRCSSSLCTVEIWVGGQ